MITIEEKISVSQDDPLAEQIENKLTEQDGWHMTETTVAKTFKRVQFIGIRETKNDLSTDEGWWRDYELYEMQND